ncbi:MAG: type II toxin-antitoxin system RatA family toxin [Acidiferrobacterales bacterium]
MTQINRSAIVAYSAEEMYRLVADIESYPEFLPWCGGTKILSKDNDELRASIDIAYKGVNKSFTTVNREIEGRRIEMSLVEGPFTKLHGIWEFTELDSDASKVSLNLEFEFSNRLIAMTVGKVFSSIADTLVDAFCQRAEQVYTDTGAQK